MHCGNDALRHAIYYELGMDTVFTSNRSDQFHLMFNTRFIILRSNLTSNPELYQAISHNKCVICSTITT